MVSKKTLGMARGMPPNIAAGKTDVGFRMEGLSSGGPMPQQPGGGG